MLADKPELQAIWDEVTTRKRKAQSDRLRRMFDVRNHCFGHFDESLPTTFLERHCDRKPEEVPPFLETTGKGKVLETLYPWAYVAFATHLHPHPFDLDEVHRRLEGLADLTKGILCVVHELISVIGRNANLEFEEVPADEPEIY